MPLLYIVLLPAEARERGGEAAEAAVAIAVIAVIIVLALVLLLCLSRIVTLQIVRIGQRNGDVQRLAGRDAVYAQRQLVARLLAFLDRVHVVHGWGRGAVNSGDDVADLQTLAGCLCAGINGIYLHAGHLAVRGLDVLTGDADGRPAGNVAVLDDLVDDILCGVDRDGEAHALNGRAAEGVAGQLGRGDADDLTVFVDECAAGVAVVDGSVGLDQAHDAVIDREVAVDRGDASVWAFIALPLFAQRDANIRIYPEQGNQQISKHIYGQFAEHLGSCIYGGLWVGPESDIPNTQGYRTDVLNALKKLQIPNLRWPGGCFADEYHWMDGIGPKENRPKMVNNNWGGTIEDNSFGTHEFLNLCELLGCEPYISGNVGSGTVEEMAKWVEYMTSEGDSPMANLRRKNGRDKAWKVKFFGVGNESWGCGGSMRPEYYSDLYRRYSTYCRNYDSNVLFKIASGASDYDYNWTETLMKQIGGRMDGISLHYYTVGDWNNKGSATDFNTEDYYWTLGKCLEIEDVVKKHIAIMDKYDPKKNIALMVDEWGTWWDVEPGTIPGHLFQQNTMRDAFVAALTLHVFHKYTDRVKMTNIAQIVNVLQSMILTKGKDMVLTPTYHVFEMYKVHQDATFLPMDLICDKEKVRDNREVPVVSASASRDSQGKIHISLANVDPRQSENIHIDLQNVTIKSVNGRILTASSINDYNTFDSPEKVKPEVFKGAKVEKGKLSVSLPPMSIVVLEVL